MKPQDFNARLKQAAVLHNIALIQKRTGVSENYYKSIESYQQALDLYTECHEYYYTNLAYNGTSSDDERIASDDHYDSHSMPSDTPTSAVNLELKIAQTLQSIAKLYVILNDDTMAIRSHEDAITILLEAKARDDAQKNNHRDGADFEFNNDDATTPEGKRKGDKGRQLSSNTPRSVTSNIFDSDSSSNARIHYNIAQLTNHERTRIISMSLGSLARIYFNQEVNIRNNHEEYDLSQEEDALQYYQESLNFLKAVITKNPVSKTSIPALSNEKTPFLEKDMRNVNDNQTDANQTPSLTQTYTIDLRKDVVSILLSMAILYQHRSMVLNVVETYEQARDVRLLLNSNPQEQEMIESLLAMAYERNKQWEEALGCYQHVLKIRKGLFGVESLEVANLYVSLSNLHRKMNDFANSLGWNNRAVSIYHKLCERGITIENGSGSGNAKGRINDAAKKFNIHRHLIGSLQNQGALYVQMNEVDRGIATYLSLIEIQLKCGGDHQNMARTLNVLGNLYMSKHEYSEAKASFSRALGLYKKYNVGNNDPDMASTLQCLCEIQVLLGDKKAEEIKPPRVPRQTRPHANEREKPNTKLSRPSIAEELLEENIYCKVVETNPSFYDDDDAVSQITFVTQQQPVRRVAMDEQSSSSQSYNMFQQNIENWSPAEYVFRAVEKVATATEEFFTGPPTTQTQVKGHPLRLSNPALPNNSAKTRRNKYESQNDFECVQEGYEVRQFESRNIIQPILTKHVSERSRFIDVSTPTYANRIVNSHGMPLDRDQTSQSIEQNHTSSTEISTAQSVAAGTEASSVYGSLAGSKFISDIESVATGTQASTLFGTNFVDSVRTGVKDDQFLTQTDISSSTSDNQLEEVKDDTPRDSIDKMLSQMNVVTCEMEGDAKPFEELLRGEKVDGENQHRSPSKQDKTFEKLSKCLDTLIELKEKYGPDHGKVIQTMSQLAALYLEIGNPKGITKYFEVLELQSKKYGHRSTQVAATHVQLGQYWTKNAEIDKATDCFSKAKEIDTYLFGNTHPQISQHLNRMGLAELERNEFDIAMDYFQEALRIQKMHLGPNEINPDVSQTMVNMGSVYYKERNNLQKIRSSKDGYENFIKTGMLGKIAFAHSERGEYIMAMNFYAEELEILNSRGDSGPALAITHTSLGKLNVKAGRYSEAMEHHTEALTALENFSDTNELGIANAKCEIGVVEFHLGNFKKASTMLENSCSVQRGILGNDHSRVAKTIYHLGVIKRVQYDIEKATQLLNQALTIQLSTVGQHNPDTILTQMEIAKVLLDSDLFEEALKQFEVVLRAQNEILGTYHPEIAWSLHFMAICFSKMDADDKAMLYLQRCFQMQKKFFKLDCPAIASTLDQIGQIHVKQGNLEKAVLAFQDSVRILREMEHYELAFPLYSLGQSYSTKCKYAESLRCFKESMGIVVRTFGLDHPFIADLHVGVGIVNTRKCYFDEAKSEFKLALQIYEKCNVSKEHSKVRICHKSMARAEREEALCV